MAVTPEADGVTFDLTIDPTSYTFIFTAPGYTTQDLGPIPYSPGESPPLQAVTLTLDQNTITGTVTTSGPGGTVIPLPGVTVSLFPDKVGAKAFTSVTTNAKGIYRLTNEGKTLGYIPDGTYILGATLSGYSYQQQPQAFQTTLPNTLVNLSLVANTVGVSVTVSSTLGSQSSLSGATLTLTPVTPSGGIEACGSGSQLVPGLGVGQSVTITSSTAAFNQVVPDVYTLSASDTGHPPQTGTTLTVCPDGSTSPSPASFVFQEGEVSGTVELPTGSGLLASNATVDLFTGTSASGSSQVLSVSCSTSSSSCTTGTFSTFVPLGSAYTVQGSMTGLTTETKTTAILTGATPSSASGTVDLNLQATPLEVDVTTTSGGATPIDLDAGTVTLTLPAGSEPYSGSAQSYHGTIVGGVAKITGVAPSATPYVIAVTDGPITGSGSISVPIGTGPLPAPATAAFGEVTGTVGLSPAPAASTPVTATVCDGSAGCATPILAPVIKVDTSGSASYTIQLPPSSPAGDVITFSAGSYISQSTAAITVADGGTVPAPTVTLSAPPPTTT